VECRINGVYVLIERTNRFLKIQLTDEENGFKIIYDVFNNVKSQPVRFSTSSPNYRHWAADYFIGGPLVLGHFSEGLRSSTRPLQQSQRPVPIQTPVTTRHSWYPYQQLLATFVTIIVAQLCLRGSYATYAQHLSHDKTWGLPPRPFLPSDVA
jgi:hypothetical protein